MAVPKILRNYNMIVNGRGNAGIVDEIELPKLSLKLEDWRSGGMDAPEGQDLGMDKIECGFTMAEHSASVLEQFGLMDGTAVQAIFKAAMVDDNSVTPYVISVRGKYSEIDPGTLKVGDKMPLKAKIYCVYYRLEQGGRTIHEIDVRGMKRIINGVDQLAGQRDAISA